MPELRRDPIVGRWVIFATERKGRPTDFDTTHPVSSTGSSCPFCPGHEGETPPEVYAEREVGPPDSEGWSLRVVSNKYPALEIEGDLDRRIDGLLETTRGIGAHEVIIETPRHEDRLSDLPAEAFARLGRAIRARILDLTRDRRFRYIQVFKNFGPDAGATLEHGHTQLIATPIVPRRLDEKLQGFASHFERTGRCILCDLLDQERERGGRVIFETTEFVALAPFAARGPYETWLVPKRHEARFEESDFEQIVDFAPALRELLARTAVHLDHSPYNFVLHTAPVNLDEVEDGEAASFPSFHWHFEILPRLTKVAGFEWGTGFYINPTAPEDAAEELRRVRLEGSEPASDKGVEPV